MISGGESLKDYLNRIELYEMEFIAARASSYLLTAGENNQP